ncbi:polyphenol oxidase family protein [Candidatus Nomurabacteria bacterium]|nr:polyphenol oxidase family protein [Candidatus Nomurabacteria bacterium]
MITYQQGSQRIVITDQGDGNLDYRFGKSSQVEANRAKLLDRLALVPEEVVVIFCEQKDRYIWVDRDDGGRGVAGLDPVTCDGLVTNSDNISLVLPIADCFGLAFWAEGVKGILHLGRFGTELGLLRQVTEDLSSRGFELVDLKFVLGPGISKESYLFDQEQPGMNPEYLTRRSDGQLCYDVKANILDQLSTLGIGSGQLIDYSYDTFSNVDQFSHRRSQMRGEPEGRFWMII